MREDTDHPQPVQVPGRIIEKETLLICMRGTEGCDLTRPRLVIANVGAEAGEVRHHHKLQDSQGGEHQQRGDEAGVGIVSQGAEVVDEGVADQRDQNRTGDESR